MKAFLSILLIAISFTLFAQEKTIVIPKDLKSPIPMDASIVTGKLSNGLTYYIKKNGTPKNRAELRLVVNAGSIQEDEDQQGLAHFTEHMAFNGTKDFKKHEIVDFMEVIGMKFGAEVNAYTSFDETVYMLTVPTDKKPLIDTGLQILSQWAQFISYEDEEVDKERGVILEEWRLGQGAQDRMSRVYLPVMFNNSRYASRLPIGKTDILKNFKYDVIKRYYADWYRPDLMAVVAVGDFDVKDIEDLVKKYFNTFPPKQNPRERVLYDVPSHKETLVSITSDKENPYSMVQVYFEYPKEKEVNYATYRESILESLYVSMLNNRLNEKMQEENPPFLFAANGASGLGRLTDAYILMAAAKTNKSMECLEMLLTESERVKRFGFTKTELERQKLEMMKGIEKLYKERDNQKSVNLAGEYQRNFLVNEACPGIEYEYELYKAFLPSITTEEVNALAKKFVTDENIVVVMTFPDKKEIVLPKSKDVIKMFKTVKAKQDITAYVDKVSDKPLIAAEPTSGKVTAEKVIPQVEATEWTLSNGVKVVLKKTDFKNDEIMMRAYSFGGQSVYPDADKVTAAYADQIVDNSGIGEFDLTELQKMLAGKNVGVSPYISDLDEGFTGSTSPDDFETLMQLTYMYFTQPRKDVKAYNNFVISETDGLKNKGTSPDDVFSDSISAILSNYNKRGMPITLDDLKLLNHDRAMSIYNDRFSDASDFVFFFVGNIDLATAKPLIEKYLGSLPATNRKENWKDLGIRNPKGIVKKTVYKGTDQKSTVYITFPGTFQYSLDNRVKIDIMVDILNIRLRENIREEQSGVYGISAFANYKKYPYEGYSIGVYFGCAPENVEKLISSVFDEISKLQKEGSLEINLNKARETATRTRENNLRENRFWMSALRSYYYNNEDFSNFTRYDAILKSITNDDVKNYATKYIDTKNYIRVVLMPETK